MKTDLGETKTYYEFQFASGDWERFGGRTNLTHVFDLLSRAGTNVGQIIDIGCGDGAVAQELYKRGVKWSHYWGIDIVAEAVHRFNARGIANSRAVTGDARSLADFPSNSISVVLCLFVLQDLARVDGHEMMENVARLLSPTGHALWALAVTSGATFEGRGAPALLKAKGCPEKQRLTWGSSDLLAGLNRQGLVELARREDPNPTHLTLTELYLLTKNNG